MNAPGSNDQHTIQIARRTAPRFAPIPHEAGRSVYAPSELEPSRGAACDTRVAASERSRQMAADAAALAKSGVGAMRRAVDDRSVAGLWGSADKAIGWSTGNARRVGRTVRTRVAEFDGSSVKQWAGVNGERPRSVKLAVVLLVLAAVLVGAQVGVVASGLHRSIRIVTGIGSAYSEPGDGTELVTDAIGTLDSALVGFVAVVAAGYLFFALAAFRGHRWPKYVGLVLAVMSIAGLMLGPIAGVAVLLGVVAVGILWLPAARRFAGDMRAQHRTSAIDG